MAATKSTARLKLWQIPPTWQFRLGRLPNYRIFVALIAGSERPGRARLGCCFCRLTVVRVLRSMVVKFDGTVNLFGRRTSMVSGSKGRTPYAAIRAHDAQSQVELAWARASRSGSRGGGGNSDRLISGTVGA